MLTLESGPGGTFMSIRMLSAPFHNMAQKTNNLLAGVAVRSKLCSTERKQGIRPKNSRFFGSRI